MTLPRQVLPGRFLFITRRCSRGQFLLRPDPNTNNVFQYALAMAKKEHPGVVVLGFTAMSNHYHMLIFDRYGDYPSFLEYFHFLVARTMNARWNRTDHFWNASQTSVVLLEDLASVIDKLAYIFTNPTKHGLVESIDRWPGAHGYTALMTGEPIRATRPHYFFTTMNPSLPAEAELPIELPPEVGDRDAFLDRLRHAIEQRLAAFEKHRDEHNIELVGRANVKRASWTYIPPDQPYTKKNRNEISPTFASKDPEIRRRIRAARRDFLGAYRTARLAWLTREPCEFPPGTYWLARYSGAPVACALFAIDVVVLLQ